MDGKEKKPNHKLRYQRELRGWSQKKVAFSIDTSKDMISRWETGERGVSLYYQERLCALFGLSAIELGFMESPEQETFFPTTPLKLPEERLSQLQDVASLLSNAVSQGIIMAVRELERLNMDKTRRDFLHMLGTSLVLAGSGGDVKAFLDHMINNDLMRLFEQEIATRWVIYHSGDTNKALDGLHCWLEEIENFAKEASTSQSKDRMYALASISYQLQGSISRDRMDYLPAHNSYKKAFLAADEFDNPEFKSSSLARRGVTFIQQKKPIEAIQYLESALSIIDPLDFPCLRGYILQALSEAYAMAQDKDQSWRHIDLAEQALTRKNGVVEASNCHPNTTAVIAQKGVNAVLLKDYRQALLLLDKGLHLYNPTLLRGRARLIAQKAEAYYGLGFISESTLAAKEAFEIARLIGSQKTISRVQDLYTLLSQSIYRKENCVVQLGTTLAIN